MISAISILICLSYFGAAEALAQENPQKRRLPKLRFSRRSAIGSSGTATRRQARYSSPRRCSVLYPSRTSLFRKTIGREFECGSPSREIGGHRPDSALRCAATHKESKTVRFGRTSRLPSKR